MKNKNDEYDLLIKALLIGDSNVGKTTIIGKYLDKNFSEKTLNTVGLDLKYANLNINNKKIKLQLWDTAGQEKFRSMTTSYYRGVNVIIIVFDVTSQISFEHVKDWMNNIKQFAKIGVMKVIVGNKIDLKDERIVTYVEGKNFAQSYNVKYFETSAITREGIVELFENICQDYSNTNRKKSIDGNIKLDEIKKNNDDENNNACCG
jgi:Ras-related protein Rab-1A